MYFRISLGLFISGLVATGVSCGGSSQDEEGTGAGTGGTVTSGAGGSSSSGGTVGGGGAGGSTPSGTGGNATNPSTCPATAPADESACPEDGLDCSYGATQCGCQGNFGGGGPDAGGLSWNCNTAQVCPAAVPAQGSPCEVGRGDCEYGTTLCDCQGDTDTWACWDPADCPTAAPAEQETCSTVGMECGYGQGLNCDCATTGWDCGRQVCPAAEPAAGGNCDGGDGVCVFGARTCDCDGSAWVCWNAADCPATNPSASPPGTDAGPAADAGACPVEGMICTYADNECECQGDGWDCGNGGNGGP